MIERLLKTSVAVLVVIVAATANIGAPKPFRIDVNHSTIGFSVPIAGGLSKVTGKFGVFKTDFQYDEADITKSSIQVTIDAKSVDTGIDKRDEHLRTADFFDVATYPEIKFVSKRVTKKKGVMTLVGDLTMHGTTREVSFPFTITGRQFDAGEKLLTVGFRATLELDRTDFGINYKHDSAPDFIGDKIGIELNIITRATKID